MMLTVILGLFQKKSNIYVDATLIDEPSKFT